MEFSSSSSSSSSILKWNYEVFLSYRSEDTGKNFTDHLFEALKTKGIYTFRHDQKLERGKEIAPYLLKAIRESWCSIVVLSSRYAFSTWCLDELTEIIACKKKMGNRVYPVFYHVDPSEVREQKGKFQEAFSKHEATFKEDTKIIQKWKNALTEVAKLSGWHIDNRHEADIIKDIVNNILRRLSHTYSTVADDLVGIHTRLKELKGKMCFESQDVRFIGICGMGGIGKTTLARVAYELMSFHFEGKSFLANVREVSGKGELVFLQKQLISEIFMEEYVYLQNNIYDGANIIRNRLRHKKVLVVIDDVDDTNQLTYLAGNRNWFGLGSRIIITSRDEHLLNTCGVEMDNIYKPTTLNDNEALLLVSLKAFKSDRPDEDFVALCKYAVKYANGLPLALKVLGSFLYGRDINEWKSAIKRLKCDSEDKILNVLRISFDGLRETEKNIFLDIACFFKGMDKNYVIEILDGCGFQPNIGTSVLVEKCLITVEGNRLWMHDLLQEMGRNIVEQESPSEPGKCSRLWKEKDIHHVLTKNTGTEVVEGIMMKGIEKKIHVSADAFLNMGRLRLLVVNNLVFSRDFTYLPSNLRLLDWYGYPLNCLPSSYKPDKLIRLNLPSSSIVKFWDEAKPLPRLKSMDLSFSQNLIKTPNLEGAPNLESLNFEGSTRLLRIHPSTGMLKSLTFLNFENCKILKSLPSSVNGLKALKTLIFSGCFKIDKLPEDLGDLECLMKFDASGTAIRKLPSIFGSKNLVSLKFKGCPRLLEIHPSIGTLQRLVSLNLANCRSLASLPSSVNGLNSLEILNLSGCSKLDKLPEDLGEAKCLKYVFLSETAICQLPSSITHLANLKQLFLHGCNGQRSKSRHLRLLFDSIMSRKVLNPKGLSLPSLSGLRSLIKLDLSECNLSEGAIPSDLGSLSSLKDLNLCNNNFVSIPPSTIQLSKLQILNLENCKRLKSFPCLSGLRYLYDLNLSHCNLPEGAINGDDLGCLSSLRYLDLSCNKFATLPPSISQLSRLSSLRLDYCKRLQSIPELPSNVLFTSARGCVSLETLPDTLKSPELILAHCFKLKLNRGCNSVLLPILRRYFQVAPNCIRQFSFVVPGCEMPNWFTHQSKGITIQIKVPPNLSKNIEWMGFVICIVFASRKHTAAKDRDDTGFWFRPIVGDQPCRLRETFSECTSQVQMTSHRFIHYLPYVPQSFPPDWESLVERNCSHFGFSIEITRPGIEIKKCGIRILYKKDVEEVLIQSTSQHSSSWFENSHDSALIKRRQEDCDGAECNESGQSYEEPQPKKLKRIIDFITGRAQLW